METVLSAIDIDGSFVPETPESFIVDEADSKLEKFVVFQVDDEFFAVPVTGVKEVALPQEITPLPGSPAWLRGLANLRGEIVAVADFPYRRLVFSATPRSKIIVFRPSDFDTAAGFVVDRISEIVAIRDIDIRRSADANLMGVATLNSTDVSLLDIDRLFNSLIVN